MIDRRPPTFGMEEEFLLLDPACGRPVPAAPSVLRLLRPHPGMQAELMRYQLETALASPSRRPPRRHSGSRPRRTGRNLPGVARPDPPKRILTVWTGAPDRRLPNGS